MSEKKSKRKIMIIVLVLTVLAAAIIGIGACLYEHRTMYVTGKIVYVYTDKVYNKHIVYVLPDDSEDTPLLLQFNVDSDTHTDSEFSIDPSTMPELTVGKKVKVLYNNHMDYGYSYDTQAFISASSEITNFAGPVYEYASKHYDSVDMDKLCIYVSGIANYQRVGTVRYVDRLDIDEYVKLFVVYIDDEFSAAPIPYIVLSNNRFNMDDGTYDKLNDGEVGFKVSFQYASSEVIDGVDRYIHHMFLVEE